jgi:hypothetical protein
MTLVESVLAVLGLSVGGVVVAVIGWLVRRILRTYRWLLVRHAVAARVVALVPSKVGVALVHGMKRALLDVVVPAPVLHFRRVPADIELVVPSTVMAELDDAGEGLADDLAVWLTQQAEWRTWALPRSEVRVKLVADASAVAGKSWARARTVERPDRSGR